MINPTTSRRSFIKTSALAAGGALGFSRSAYAAILGANDRIRFGVIGCGGMGRHDVKLASAFANIVGVCDVEAKRAEEASKQFDGAIA